MKKKAIGIALAGMLAVSAFAGFGCTSGNQASSSSSSAAESSSAATEEPAADIVIGTDESGAVKLTATNATGQNINSISVKSITSQDWPLPLEQASSWTDGTVADIFVPSSAMQASEVTAVAEDEQSSNDEATEVSVEDVAMELLIDMKLTMGDGSLIELHQINPSAMNDFTVNVEEGIGYITFKDEDGLEISTLEAEKAYAENAAAAQAEAEAAKAAEEQAAIAAAEAEAQQQAQQQQQQAQQQQQQQQQSSGSSTSKKTTGSSTSSDGEDDCVDDLVLN